MSAPRCQNRSGKKLRFFQFGLRQLFLLFALLGLLLGLVAPRIRESIEDRQFQSDLRRKREIEANFVEAVRKGDAIPAKRWLDALDAGTNPNTISDGRNGLLRTSIENGSIEIVEMLLDCGTDLEMGSPLVVAVECDQPTDVRLKMIRCLLQHGADPHGERGGQSAMNSAVRAADAEVGDLLREFGVEYGPREMAAFNRLQELRQVVEENPSVVRDRFEPVYASRPGYGPTLLGFAMGGGYREMAVYLIDHGAPVDMVEGRGSTLLHRASRGGDPELIRLLVARGLDVNARDDYGDTPLVDSVWSTRVEAIEALIEAGTDLNARGINQATALHMAARGGRSEVVSMLLAAGADPTIVDLDGETALDLVRMKTSQLLEAQTVPALRDKSDKTDLGSTVQRLREIEKLLLKADSTSDQP